MKIVIKQERKVVVATTSFTPPLWMQYALKGEKINAIKELRNVTGKAPEGKYVGHRWVDAGFVLGLKEAKDIVETVTNGIVTNTDEV